jgi:8-oxo-dGTP diphosphatase
MSERVRAIIRNNNSLLLIHRVKNGHEYWVFPGGGIEQSDVSPEAALERECFEELGVSVSVNKLFVKNNDEFFYECLIIGGQLGTGNGPEFQEGTSHEGLYALEWIPMQLLVDYEVLPAVVKEAIGRDV